MFGSKKIRAVIAAGAALMFLMATAGAVLADELSDRQQELDAVQQQINEQQNRLSGAQEKVDTLSGQLQTIQIDLDAAQKDYNGIQTKLSNTENQIEVNNQILAKAEKNLAERSKILNKRLRDIYENGQVNYLDVLLGAADFGDFTTRMDVLKRVLSQDLSLIAKVKAERELVIQKRAELERDRAAILQLKQDAAAKKAVIESRKSERQGILNQAVNQRDAEERAYNELRENSRQIEQMIRNIQSGKPGDIAAGGSGTFIWPAAGPITSPFGWRTHPIFGTARYHSGIDIGADYGDPIRAADSGVVIYADWMGGYGKAVIIDHGNGLSTLYGHNSELLVSEGQRVRKGQTIAYCGATGYATGPHSHFEVRENGSPVNPLSYLP